MTPKISDKALGISTNGVLSLQDFQFSHVNLSHARRYEATPYHILDDMLIDVHADFRDFAFIDLGSGKGRVTILACQLPFKKVIGVEFVPRLVKQARANHGKIRPNVSLCSDIEFVSGDAAEYEFPRLPLVIYLFNPFTEVVLTKVLRNLSRSLSAKPRAVFIMYYMPEFEDSFGDFPEFTKTAMARDWSIFQNEESLK